MEISLKFKIDNLNNIVIKDTTIYESEFSGDFIKYRKEDTGSIFVLGYHYPNNKEEYTTPLYINKHTENSEYLIKVPKDGWITLYHIILPTKEYVQEMSRVLPDYTKKFQYLYYIDNGQVLDWNRNDAKVDLETLLQLDIKEKSFLIGEQDYISIWNLQKCLVNLCSQIFDNLGAFGKCFNSSSIDDELKYKRDLVWMAIHVIRYLAKCNMEAEAARIITQLEGCNGICTQTTAKTSRGCGCGK